MPKRTACERVLAALRESELVELEDELRERFIVIAKIDIDGVSDRRAFSLPDAQSVRVHLRQYAHGRVAVDWWPDVVIDTAAPIERAVRDASAGDGFLGDPYPFDEEHVIFA